MTNDSLWPELLAIFGGNAAAVLAVAWLAKALVSYQLDKARVQYERQLADASDRSLREFQHALDRTLSAESVRFQYLQERRARTICEIWDHVILTRTALRDLTARIRWHGPVNHGELLKAAWIAYSELHNVNLVCTLLFPPAFCAPVDAYRRLALTLYDDAKCRIEQATEAGDNPDRRLGDVYTAVIQRLEPLEAPLLAALRAELGMAEVRPGDARQVTRVDDA